MTKRVIVYEMKDGSEEVFEMKTVEDEQHERAHADRELSSKGTLVAGYHFEWREFTDENGNPVKVDNRPDRTVSPEIVAARASRSHERPVRPARA